MSDEQKTPQEQDEEVEAPVEKTTRSQGGILPQIHGVLLPKSSKDEEE